MESVKTKVKRGKANLSNKANNNYKNWRIKRRCFYDKALCLNIRMARIRHRSKLLLFNHLAYCEGLRVS